MCYRCNTGYYPIDCRCDCLKEGTKKTPVQVNWVGMHDNSEMYDYMEYEPYCPKCQHFTVSESIRGD